ncbi:hypothetical protein FRC07_006388, partial [Ceratobasidium sp. 392]
MQRSQARVTTSGYGQGFGLLSSDTIVVPRCAFTYETQDQPMACLDVFSFKVVPLEERAVTPPPDPNNDSNWTIDIDHIATLELPIIRSVAETPVDASWIRPGDLAINCLCDLCGDSPATLDSPKIWVMDFSRRKLRHHGSQTEVCDPVAADVGIYQPALEDACTPSA